MTEKKNVQEELLKHQFLRDFKKKGSYMAFWRTDKCQVLSKRMSNLCGNICWRLRNWIIYMEKISNILRLLLQHDNKIKGRGKLRGLIKHLEGSEIDKKWWIILKAEQSMWGTGGKDLKWWVTWYHQGTHQRQKQNPKKKKRNMGFAPTCLIRGSIRSRDERKSDILQNELIVVGSNPDGQTDALTGKV